MKRRLSLVLVVAMFQLVSVSSSFAAPIHKAARDGDLAEVTRLIAEDRENLEAPDEFGRTPLHYATSHGNTAIVQSLLAHGADVEKAVIGRGNTPLHLAAMNGNTASARALIAHGADVNAANRDGYTPLHEAAKAGRTATVQVLIAAGADVEKAVIGRGNTPLHLAAMNGHAATSAALQPQAIAQLHTQTADAHTTAGNHGLAARSHTWAAQALPGTEDAIRSHTRAAESFIAAGDHAAAARSYDLAGNHVLAAESHTQHAHAQAAAGDYASAVEHYRLSHAAHTALGNHEAAGLSHRFATLLAPAVPVKDHLASAHGHSQAIDIHFRTAVVKVGEIQSHRGSGDEVASALAEAQLQESLESADRSAANAISTFEAALVALDGALLGATDAHKKAQVADAPAPHLAQHAAQVASLQAHMRSVSSKIDETRASAANGHERVSAARGI